MSEHYFTIDSDKTDMKKYSKYVKVRSYSSHIEGVGVAYQRPWKTIPELNAEIDNLKNLHLSQEEYNRRLQELQAQIEKRRQVHKPKTKKSKVRTDNMQYLKKSQNNYMNYMYSNFDCPFCRMATLTYATKVYDMKITMKDFKKFRKKFKDMFPNAVWVAYFDYHKDKSTHIHFIFKNARGATHDILTKMWGLGCAYVTEFDQSRIPYFCKNECLEWYPSNTKLFTHSQNCRKSKEFKVSVDQFEDMTKGMECTYTGAKTLYVDKKDEVLPVKLNHFIYKKFNRNRKED